MCDKGISTIKLAVIPPKKWPFVNSTNFVPGVDNPNRLSGAPSTELEEPCIQVRCPLCSQSESSLSQKDIGAVSLGPHSHSVSHSTLTSASPQTPKIGLWMNESS